MHFRPMLVITFLVQDNSPCEASATLPITLCFVNPTNVETVNPGGLINVGFTVGFNQTFNQESEPRAWPRDIQASVRGSESFDITFETVQGNNSFFLSSKSIETSDDGQTEETSGTLSGELDEEFFTLECREPGQAGPKWRPQNGFGPAWGPGKPEPGGQAVAFAAFVCVALWLE
ncbi:hypothetical protein BC826DRAFT_1176688 [Russula brevipes]|nr:hypothetical protein BC826DRAFT_1176688 [Russula brevipes]